MRKAIVLALNGGSSSLKFALFQFEEQAERTLARGAVERIGPGSGSLWIRDAGQTILAESHSVFRDNSAAAEAVFTDLVRLGLPAAEAVGHRLVHGGLDHVAPQRVTESVLAGLRGLIAFAPLHLPGELALIETVSKHSPTLPQVACFDTAFHRRMPELAQRFPLPRMLWDQGVRRYGFHGLSYEYIVNALGPSAPARVIIAHLGNGSSLAAVRDGSSADTTMGFTPTGGVMMGTRSGDIDPGVLLYLMGAKRYGREELDTLVNQQGGLLGASGISSDMKTLLDRSEAEPAAAQAVEMFCYSLRKSIGALASVLGGLDLLVFTGGIGERAAPVREKVCAGLKWLGIELDHERNRSHADTISVAGSACAVRVIPTDEDLMIARHTYRLIFAS